uniref:Uncharacterized protein n=1 Tax=Caenorhabditis japonica TaxID=281687 RepID=A0A8R1IDX1_CAEJA
KPYGKDSLADARNARTMDANRIALWFPLALLEW